MRTIANEIIEYTLHAVLPDEAVKKALCQRTFEKGNLYVVAAGKAAWQMAKAAEEVLGNQITKGIVITKYHHVKGDLQYMQCFEAGHPVPDENSYRATKKAVELVSNLNADDHVLFLLSGGGSALFEIPLISNEELSSITQQLLGCGADIKEMNTIRKRLSAVKGGKFAQICQPANVFSIVLSDVLGDPLDMIASGPAYPDSTTCHDAMKVINKYQIQLSQEAITLLNKETPKVLDNVETMITGSVKNLCEAASEICLEKGYLPIFLTDELCCEAREAGSFMASIARSYQNTKQSVAFILGGESVVHLKGTGKGGRNQELALSASIGLSGLKDTALFSIGSDGTDGPTDAAGGYVDGTTVSVLKSQGLDPYEFLEDNNAYFALEKTGGLIFTGPTGTNVNDVCVLLIKR